MSVKEDSDKLLRNHVVWALGAGLVPIPMLDVAAVSTIQMDLVKRLAELYKHDYSESQAKSMVVALAGSVGARITASALKIIPGVGPVVAGITMSALSGATTYAIGKVFIKHFESGGTLLNFDPIEFKSYFEEQLQKGKSYVKNLQKNDQKKLLIAREEKTDAEKIKELVELKDQGVLTEEEFNVLKNKVIQQNS